MRTVLDGRLSREVRDMAQGSTTCMLKSALRYAQKGWRVLPLVARGKRPLTRHGVKDATTEPEVLNRWWQRWPEANIGIAVPLGCVVLDLDSHTAGEALRSAGFELPSTVKAETGRGCHLWYATGSAGIRSRVDLFSGVDLRAPGSYLVAPPSLHPSGVRYRWQVELRRSAITECPGWLLSRLEEAAKRSRRSEQDWHRRIASPVSRGHRNQALAEVSGLLFRRLPAKVAAELALCWAQVKLSPPLPPSETRRTIDSIAGRELRRREGQP